MATTEKETPSKKAAAPSVSQINAEYVTQVTLSYLHIARRFCSIVFAEISAFTQKYTTVVLSAIDMCSNVFINSCICLSCTVSVG